MRLAVRVVLFTLSLCVAAAAQAQATYTTGFEPPEFTLGDVNGQNGWGHLSNSPTGGAIEPVPAGSPPMFGAQSLAIRTRETDFFNVANHLFSPIVDPPAGENGSTVGGVAVPDPRTYFSATLWVHTPPSPVISTRTDGRFAELNPSSKGTGPGDAANRYAQVRLVNTTNTAAGLVRVEMTWFPASVVTVATLQWNTWYRFEYLIELIDGVNGTQPNDRFTLTIFDLAGNVAGSACGSTWEIGWKSGSFGGGTSARAINGFDFWSLTGPDGTLVAHLDNMTITAFDAAARAVTIAGNANVCSGGTALLTAMPSGGGAAVASYAWRDADGALVGTASTLSAGAGTYTVTVTDTLCASTTSAPFTVTANAPLAVSITGSSSAPMGGVVTLTANASGGSGTVAAYEWRSANGLVVGSAQTADVPPGTYTVTVMDASCGNATSPAFTVDTASVPAVPAAGGWALLALTVSLAAIAMLHLSSRA